MPEEALQGCCSIHLEELVWAEKGHVVLAMGCLDLGSPVLGAKCLAAFLCPFSTWTSLYCCQSVPELAI